MTVITNTLVDPQATGTPQVGVVVRAYLVPAVAFLADGTAEIVTHAETVTGADGTWELDLTPQSQIVPAGSQYRIAEGTREWTVTVPDAGPVTLLDALTTPVPVDAGLTSGLTQAQADARYVPLTDTRLTDARPPILHAGTHATAGTDPVTPAAIGAATTSHTHTGLQATAEKGQPGGYAALDANGLVPTAQLPAATGGPSAVSINNSITGLTDFTGAAGTGTWTLFPTALQATVAASAGDVVVYEVQILSTGSDAEMDAAAVVSGAPVRFYSTGTAIQNPRGHGGLYVSGDYGLVQPHRVVWVVQAGDLDTGGNLTLAFLYRAGTGHTWTTAATTGDNTAYPAAVSAINLGSS